MDLETEDISILFSRHFVTLPLQIPNLTRRRIDYKFNLLELEQAPDPNPNPSTCITLYIHPPYEFFSKEENKQ
jgi:hypothetical protein